MAGVYERRILPRLLDLSMRNRLLHHYRQRAIETARGLVLKVGVNSRQPRHQFDNGIALALT